MEVILHNLISYNQLAGWKESFKSFGKTLDMSMEESDLINDYYNSDFGSLGIALDFMAQQKQQTNKTIILSDILQSGKSDEVLYKSVADLFVSKGIKKIIGIRTT